MYFYFITTIKWSALLIFLCYGSAPTNPICRNSTKYRKGKETEDRRVSLSLGHTAQSHQNVQPVLVVTLHLGKVIAGTLDRVTFTSTGFDAT